jgi:hypothetical protein
MSAWCDPVDAGMAQVVAGARDPDAMPAATMHERDGKTIDGTHEITNFLGPSCVRQWSAVDAPPLPSWIVRGSRAR